jgi:glucokinase-like ROK family protein
VDEIEADQLAAGLVRGSGFDLRWKLYDRCMVENETQAAIVRTLCRAGVPLSRQRLGSELRLGRNTLGAELRRLAELGLVEEGDAEPSNGGRPSRQVRVPREAGLVAALDIGGTSIDVGITTLTSEVVAARSVSSMLSDGPEAVLTRAYALVDQLLDEHELAADAVRAVGVGVPGPVSEPAGDTFSPPAPSRWDGYPIRAAVAERFSAPTFVDNDANVMAIGEHLRGAGRGVDDFLFVKLGMGIGAGIVSGGRLVRGAVGGAGELGHVVVEPGSDIVCPCGNVGCLQAFVGAPGLARAAEAAADDGSSPELQAIRERKLAPLEPTDLAAAARAADPAAVAIVRAAGRRFGSALAATVSLLNPALIVLGGGIVGLGDTFLAEIRTTVYRQSLPLATRTLPIVRTELGSTVGVIGASLAATQLALFTGETYAPASA